MEPSHDLGGRQSDREPRSRSSSLSSLSSWPEDGFDPSNTLPNDIDDDMHIDDDMPNDEQPGSATGRPKPSSRSYRRQDQRKRKLLAVVKTLKKQDWSFATFLSAWVHADDDEEEIVIPHRRYSRVALRRRALQDAVARDSQLRTLFKRDDLESNLASQN